MSTIAQIEANQLNSKLSTGPRTPGGKIHVFPKRHQARPNLRLSGNPL